MRIIDIGICVNNVDPKGIGRIRYRPYGLYVSEIENIAKYADWDESDPFIAIPFLPLHINIVPQIQQSVKIIKYDTDKDTQNIEYIAGPYTSPHDMQSQTFAAQHRDTTYGGVIIKEIKDIRNKNGKFNNPASPSAIIRDKDTGFRGNYGSDIIFTENGVQLRGGLLYSKDGHRTPSLLNYPQLAKKMGRFSLKKFPKAYTTYSETTDNSSLAVGKLNYIIEYEINSLSSPTQLSLFIYKVLDTYGTSFNTNIFGQDTFLDTTNTQLVKLINTGNTISDATYIKSLNGTIQDAYIQLRELLHLIDMDGIKVLNNAYSDEDPHPFYYRPTSSFKLTKGVTTTEMSNKTTFYNKIQVRSRTGHSGLAFSRRSLEPPLITGVKILNILKEEKNSGEQSFSNLSADKIYITTTSPNVGVNVKSINFNELDDYELSQDDYLRKIDPNTQPMVRGENLYNVLMAIKNLLDSHIHNINEPLVKTDPNWIKLNNLIETLRNDLLNDNIRIN